MLSLTTFKPLGRRLIVRPILRKADKDGIYIPEDLIVQDDNIRAEVLKLGSGDDYPTVVGGTVIIPLRAGQDMKFEEGDLRLISESHIIATVDAA